MLKQAQCVFFSLSKTSLPSLFFYVCFCVFFRVWGLGRVYPFFLFFSPEYCVCFGRPKTKDKSDTNEDDDDTHKRRRRRRVSKAKRERERERERSNNTCHNKGGIFFDEKKFDDDD